MPPLFRPRVEFRRPWFSVPVHISTDPGNVDKVPTGGRCPKGMSRTERSPAQASAAIAIGHFSVTAHDGVASSCGTRSTSGRSCCSPITSTSGPRTVAGIYKERWQIELFFKYRLRPRCLKSPRTTRKSPDSLRSPGASTAAPVLRFASGPAGDTPGPAPASTGSYGVGQGCPTPGVTDTPSPWHHL